MDMGQDAREQGEEEEGAPPLNTRQPAAPGEGVRAGTETGATDTVLSTDRSLSATHVPDSVGLCVQIRDYTSFHISPA